MRQTNMRQATILILIVVVTLGAILRLYHLGELSLWNDEVATVRLANNDWKTMILDVFWKNGEANMAFYYGIIHYWMEIVSTSSDAMLRLPSAIFSIITIPAIYLFGAKLGKDKQSAMVIGGIAAALLAVNAWHIQYAQELRAYSLVTLLTILSTYLFIRGLQKQTTSAWTLYGVVAVVAVYTHYYSGLLILAHALALLTLAYLKYPIAWRKVLITGSGIALGLMPMAVVAIAVIFRGADKLQWIPALGADEIYEFFHALSGNGGNVLMGLLLSVAFLGSIVVIQRTMQREENWFAYLILFYSLVMPVAVTFLISWLVRPIFVPRFLLLVQPFLIVLVAIGIDRIMRQRIRVAGWGVAAALGVMLMFFSFQSVQAYHDDYTQAEFRVAAGFMEEERQIGDGFLYYYWRADNTMLYYNPSLGFTVNKQRWVELLKETDATPEEILQFVPDYPRVWLVISRIHPDQRPQLQEIQEALQTRYSSVEKFTFTGLRVERYGHDNIDPSAVLYESWRHSPKPIEQYNRIEGTQNDDVLEGTPGDDIIFGWGGNDRLIGKGGDDILCGGEGDDDLQGHGGDDRLDGGPGNDTINGGYGKDILWGREGDDNLSGGGGGGDLEDLIFTGAGKNIVGGGIGDYRIDPAVDSKQIENSFISGCDEPSDSSPRASIAEQQTEP